MHIQTALTGVSGVMSQAYFASFAIHSSMPSTVRGSAAERFTLPS